jgi:gentisate 1,2-dioxygenase
MSSPQKPAPGTLRAAIGDAQLHPLWEFPRTDAHQVPNRVEPAFHWKWSELSPIIDRSAAEVGMEDADRRALLLANPHLRPAIQTTTNLMAAIQVLQPGDRAVEHRHSAAAIRLIIEAEGGWTSVDGVEAEMAPGDFILTPGWTWHGHANETSSRVIWLDGLDSPFVRAVDANFFEPHSPNLNLPHVSGDWIGTGLASASGRHEAQRFSPQIRYPWKATSEALAMQAPGPDGSVTLRYVNPGTGGAVMPTLDCYVLRLARGRTTVAQRSTANVVCFVMSGEGMSRIGANSISWRERDVFTIPHWTWAAHKAESSAADLFVLTDRELFRRLNLLREETSSES